MHHGYELTLATPTDHFAPSMLEMNPEVAEHRALIRADAREYGQDGMAAAPRRRISLVLLAFVFLAGIAVGQGWALA